MKYLVYWSVTGEMLGAAETKTTKAAARRVLRSVQRRRHSVVDHGALIVCLPSTRTLEEGGWTSRPLDHFWVGELSPQRERSMPLWESVRETVVTIARRLRRAA